MTAPNMKDMTQLELSLIALGKENGKAILENTLSALYKLNIYLP